MSVFTLQLRKVDWSRMLALVLVGCFAVFFLTVLLHPGGAPPGGDFNRVWDGALRLRSGESLYVNLGDERGFYTWTTPVPAWIAVPLTYLPQSAVAFGWIAVCLVGWAASLWPARRAPGVLLLLGPLTLLGAWSGNLQPLMTTALVFGIGRRWGPLAVGASAALKVSPVLLLIPWMMNGQWRKVGLALATAAALSAPALFSGIHHYPLGLNPSLSLRSVGLVLFIIVAAAATTLTVALARTRYRWWAAAVAVMASRPSLVLYDVGYLLVSLPPEMRTQAHAKRR